MFDFFISHSSIDKYAIVDDLVNILQNMGYKIWYDRDEILAGDNIVSKIKNGLRNSYCLILILTSNFMESKWTFYEIGSFDMNEKNRIVPLIYNIDKDNKNELLSIINNRKYLDMNVLTKEEVAGDLARTLNKIKSENNDLQAVENLTTIQKKLASFETINSEIISMKLKEYLELLESKKEFLILAAKQIVKIVSEDLLKNKGLKMGVDINSITLPKLLNEHNIGNVNFREYIEYILSLDSDKSAYGYIHILNHALSNILLYYTKIKYPTTLTFSNIEVVFSQDLKYNDFIDMFEIDKKVMREDLIASIDTTYAWFQYNEYTHIGVRDIASKRIVGYFSILPVTDETYDKIICGDFEDKEFTVDDIVQYNFPDFYRIYVAGVGIDPEYQNTGAFIKLYNAFIDLILLLARDREIYISEILAEASTKQGEKFCKMVGMKKISNTVNDTNVYRLIAIPPEFRLKNSKGKELYNLCQKKYEEYREYFENK